MKKKSLANLEVYKSKTKTYEEFVKAEDHPRKIEKFTLPYIKNKIVLDVGCGVGKYAKIFGPSSKKYFALDVSEEQLKLAKKNEGNVKKVKFIHSSAEKIPLSDKSVDVVFSSWVISVIKGFRRKKKALQEIDRVLKESGKIFVVEGDSKGEFEEMRGHLKRTEYHNNWLRKQGFKERKIKTYFKFKNMKKAKEIFNEFWGKSISNKIKSEIIKQEIIIFTKTK